MRAIDRHLVPAAALSISAALSFGAVARGDDGDTPRPPQRLSETGLFMGPGTSKVDPRNLSYSPQYPLWSDGAGKSRWVYLPPGKKIDARDMDAWEFPVGTRFWKEFAFAGHKVETRFIWRATEKDWVFATYLWNEDQTDAALAPESGNKDYYEIASGKSHSIPGVRDCKACHEGGRTRVLGFSALQLSTERDPLAPHAEPLRPGMVTLRTLVERKLVEPAGEELLLKPPRIPATRPLTRAVLGYLSTNCGACHNAESSLAYMGLSLKHSSHAASEYSEPGFQTTVGVGSRYAIPGVSRGESKRIRPAAPERSSVLYRMSSRRPSSQMPPLGTVTVDEEAVGLLRRWIAEELQPAP
jgi:hypothetical protein